jgi:hypothetical protein
MDNLQIRNVLATPATLGRAKWICQPIDLGVDDRICSVCRKHRLKPLATECPNCRAKILWDMG